MKLVDRTFAGTELSLLGIVVVSALLDVSVFMGVCLRYLGIVAAVGLWFCFGRVDVYFDVRAAE